VASIGHLIDIANALSNGQPIRGVTNLLKAVGVYQHFVIANHGIVATNMAVPLLVPFPELYDLRQGVDCSTEVVVKETICSGPQELDKCVREA